LQTCFDLEVPQQLLVFPMSTVFDVYTCGVSYEAYATDTDLMVRCHLETVQRFDYDWTLLHVDGAMETEPLGVSSGPNLGGRGDQPWVPVGHLPANGKTLARLSVPDPQSDGRMPLLLKALSAVRAKLGDRVCVTGRLIGPFQLMTYLYGTTEGLILLYKDPQLVRETLAFFLELEKAFAQAQLEAGAHALYLCDLNSASRLISADHYREFVFAPYRQLVRWIHQQQGWVIYHPNDPDAERLRLMADTGVDAITVGDGADVVQVKQHLGNKICLMGNIDPIPFFKEGGPEEMRREVERIIDGVSQQGGHILSSGASIPIESPPQNMTAFVQTARDYWRTRYS
jgi:uroporphyrinogen decarboxylase